MISHGRKVAGLTDKLVAQRQELVNKDLWNNLAAILGLGAGLGLTARGAQGVYNVGRHAFTQPKTLGPKTITIPTPNEEEKNASIGDTAGEFFGGAHSSNWKSHPLAIPGALAAGSVGTIGGWKLMDYVLDKQRRAEQESELAKARQQYEQALLSQHDKGASALGKDLDRLFDLLEEKRASLGDTAGTAFGLATAPAGALALISGLVTHNVASKRRQQALLQKAMAKRRREQAQINPTRIYAIPKPMLPSGTMNSAPTEEELNGDPLDKVANKTSADCRGSGPQSLVPGAR